MKVIYCRNISIEKIEAGYLLTFTSPLDTRKCEQITVETKEQVIVYIKYALE